MNAAQPAPLQRVRATYLMETALDAAVVAEAMAGEQSSGTFIALPQEDQALKDRAAARVESLSELAVLDAASLPGAQAPRGDAKYRRYALTLSWPLANFGPSLPNLVATVAGTFAGLPTVMFMQPPTEAALARFKHHRGIGIAGTARSCPLPRLVFAGGDSSGRIVGQLPIEALEAVAPLVRGAPICRAHSPDARFDGTELVLKGGQAGDADFFVAAKVGAIQRQAPARCEGNP